MRLRSILAALICLLMPPAAAGAQSGLMLSGAVLYPQKVALADNALLVVQLQTLDGTPIGAVRQPTNGAQVPLPFAIQGPANAPFGLRAALFVDGAAIWASPLVVIQPARGRRILPPVILNRVDAASFAEHFACGKIKVRIALDGSVARMQAGSGSYELSAKPAGGAVRYVDRDDPGTWFAGKGNAPSIEVAGRALKDCTPEIAPLLFPLRAGGTEPGWRLDLAAGRLVFTPQDGQKIDAPIPLPLRQGDGLRLDLPDGRLTALLRPGLCHDIATGLPHPLKASVTAGGKTFAGCGGTPAQVLEGAPWRVLRAASTDLNGSGAEMRFLANQVSGRAPCNRFSARMMFGEGLRFGPLAATRTTCKAMAMTQEAAFFNALGAADGFDVVKGELHLMARGQVVLVARR